MLIRLPSRWSVLSGCPPPQLEARSLTSPLTKSIHQLGLRHQQPPFGTRNVLDEVPNPGPSVLTPKLTPTMAKVSSMTQFHCPSTLTTALSMALEHVSPAASIPREVTATQLLQPFSVLILGALAPANVRWNASTLVPLLEPVAKPQHVKPRCSRITYAIFPSH